ncbi:phosphodiester glycosidase family protein [Sanyastnella coralliicola]|uniref:phosphodiester glycosidase family protein n=1 Tax=Sanyastnella coralliicola TaxID=3069118 RepID=UPI0027B8B6A9|nr:phosphodiester glycosidase family protein [Longitalea sp. SCSIO 12813]
MKKYLFIWIFGLLACAGTTRSEEVVNEALDSVVVIPIQPVTSDSVLVIPAVDSSSVMNEAPIVSHIVDPASGELFMAHKDSSGNPLRSLGKLKAHVEAEGKTLTFAMNGGMYMEDREPLGLYIEKGLLRRKMNWRKDAHGNFYMQPNGVFCLTSDGEARIMASQFFEFEGVYYATQSGPLLLIRGEINDLFNEGSTNLNIRNGVGILPDGKVIFAMSTEKINFYDFAAFFQEQGCQFALYLDGFVSRLYLPEKGHQDLQGNFGVMIGTAK